MGVINEINKVIIYLLPFLWLFHVTCVFPKIKDTIPPTYTWITPEQLSIHSTNSLRLCVDAQDNINGSGIEKVVFYAEYYDHSDRRMGKHITGEVKNYPYKNRSKIVHGRPSKS